VCEQDPYCCEVMWDDLCVQTCQQTGACGPTCEPTCDQLQCGYDCNGQYCGECPGGMTCLDGFCLPVPPDGCSVHDWPGCGGCGCESLVCLLDPSCCQQTWHEGCVQYCQMFGGCGCQPSCANKQCGDDGCGGSCGSCPAGTACNSQGFCQAGGKTCQQIVDCALGQCLVNGVPDLACFTQCSSGASQAERAQFQELFQCVAPYCVQSPTVDCFYSAAKTACMSQYLTCIQ
jgi:hypothetical protein